ncbi:MAG: epoxyqueuosine reductase QueH [Lachnospiraceae bacterium]
MTNTPKPNFQKELEKVLKTLENQTPKLLLHACCAPCSSYVLEYLSNYFKITVFFYNPNITDEGEYKKRVEEVKRLISEMDLPNEVDILEGRYEPEEFLDMARGLELEPEGGSRCYECYKMRLKEAAFIADKYEYPYFTTTLSISPHKNAVWINEIGREMEKEYRSSFLPSDFKKKNGFKRSIELSEQHHLYRQNFCGCIYSRNME